ncbi:CGNR zinc finger domain-containing protein [Nonomuraea soli]|uniref:Putative RNA-binding Zn ribbon-like protein n=1 Tax=Nonomuraea soli TaxID=1032476 RepID=A0A7W0CL75_9ACTN|nr:ABATE domain-containing protein [Nonomuraea soli]MBA2893224.1 putative RNA-binding Zn ribbon-like protein [Nonomuraea soli]
MEMVLTGRDGQSFRFDAGALCLEFLLSGVLEPWERLHEAADLADWIPRSRLGVEGPVEVGGHEIDGAKRLRAAIWRLAVAVTGDKEITPPLSGEAYRTGERSADLETLNEFAAAPPPVPVIDGELRRSWAAPVTGTQFLSAVARDAVELFGGDRLERLRMCGGDRCVLIFLDTSRPGARRWCSMDRCGNRHKMRTRRTRA